MTLEEMASAARNNIGSGLNESADFTYSVHQIYDELSNAWNTIIYKMSQSNQRYDMKHFTMPRYDIPLKVADLPHEIGRAGYTGVLSAEIPKVAMLHTTPGISFIGPPDMLESYYVYTDPKEIKSHRYSRVIKNRPFVFLDLTQKPNGQNDIYVFNLQEIGLEILTMYFIAADPVGIMTNDGYVGIQEEFPAPLNVQQMMIDTVVEKFIRYYRSLNPGVSPDSQTDKN